MFKKVLIAGDNHGDRLAQKVLKELENLNIAATILPREDKDSYIEVFNRAVVKFKSEKTNCAMVLICGTGVGASMLANRFKGVRAVLANDKQTAYFARRHENANCLCLAGGYTDGEKQVKSAKDIKAILESFFTTGFEGERHKKRVDALDKIGE